MPELRGNSRGGTSPRQYAINARLAYGRFQLSRREGPRARGKRWMRKWAETDEGKKHLLQFAYSSDPWLAFAATRLLFEYAFGRPGAAPEDQAKGLVIDWRQYEGVDGKNRLKEDLAKEFKRYTNALSDSSETEKPDRR